MKRLITFLIILAFISPFSIISSQAAVKDCKPLNVPVLGYDNLLITIQSIAIKNPGNDSWIEVDYKIDNPTNQRIRKGNFTLYFASQGSHSDAVNWIIEPNSSLSRKTVLGYNDTEWPYILAYEEYDFSPQEGYESIVWQLPGRNCEYVSPSDGKSRAEAAAAANKAAAAEKAAAEKAAAEKAAAEKAAAANKAAAADKAAADKAAAEKAAAEKAAADERGARARSKYLEGMRETNIQLLADYDLNYFKSIQKKEDRAEVIAIFKAQQDFIQKKLRYPLDGLTNLELITIADFGLFEAEAKDIYAIMLSEINDRLVDFASFENSIKTKTTISCIKGKLIKKITAVKPKCPAGYKVKK